MAPRKGQFQPGDDPRRNLKGRPPSGCAMREIFLELAEINDQPGATKGEKIARKRAVAEAVYQAALVEKDKSMLRFLFKELILRDFGTLPGGEGAGENLDPEIEELIQGIKANGPTRSTSTIPASSRSSGKKRKKKAAPAKAGAKGSILPARVPARKKGRG